MGNFLRPFSDSLYHGYDRVENHEELRTYLTALYHKKKDMLGYNDFYANAYTTFAVDPLEEPEFDLINLPLFAPLRKLILNRASQLIDDQVSYNEGSIPTSCRTRPLKFTELWFNVNPPGAYQGKHHHADNLLGGTYYIQVPKDTGAIRFFNPNNFANFKLFSGERNHLMKLSADLVPTDGQLLLWPGYFEHEVTTNLSTDGIRISISWGIDWD